MKETIFNAETKEYNEVDYAYSPTEEELNFINKRNKEIKIVELKKWFSNFFDYQFKQSLWQTNFTISHDDFFNKDYANVEELKLQAEFVRAEIKRLLEEL